MQRAEVSVMRRADRVATTLLAVWVAAGGAQQCFAQRCSGWEWTNPRPSYVSLTSITWTPAGFLATGTGGPLTSTDGQSWVVRRTAPVSSWSAVLWDGSRYVAVGSNRIATGPDGFAWTTRYEFQGSPRGESIGGLAFNGTTYVAVGRDNGGFQAVVFTSPDGVEWTRRQLTGPNSSSSGLSGVVWTGTQFVAVGLYQDAVATSPDGANWTWHPGPRAQSIAFNGEWLVAVGFGQASRSRDSITWENAALPNPNLYLYGVAWGRDRFVAVGERGSIFTSTDGSSWRDRSRPGWDTFTAVTFAGGRFVVVGTDVLSSADGETWAGWLEKVDVRFINAVAGRIGPVVGPTDYEFVAVGDIESVLYSKDGGVNWSKVDAGLYDLPLDAWLGDVIWTGTQFVAVGSKSSTLGSGGIVLLSPDGAAWDRVDVGDNLRNVAWDGQRLVAVGVEAVLTSQDGHAWTRASMPAGLAGEIASDVAGGGSRSVIAFNSESVAVSGDDASWTRADTGTRVSRVTWGGGRFVAWGWGVVSSPDGVSWTPVAGLTTPPAEIVWIGSAFAGWDPGSASWWTSPDGVSWSKADGMVPAIGDGRTFAFAGSVMVAAGSSGQLTRAVCGTPWGDLMVPSTGHLPGLEGTQWRTDLVLFNRASYQQPATVEIRLLPRGSSATDPAVVVRTVPVGEQLVVRDALYEMFGADGAATLRLTSWGGEAWAWARTYNQGSAGTYGQGIPARPGGEAQVAGDEARLIGLGESLDAAVTSRTNLGLVNTSGTDAHVALHLLEASGAVLGSEDLELLPNESVQLDRVFRGVTQGPVDGGVIVVSVDEGLDKILAYASVVDDHTGDPIFVEPSAAASVGATLWLPAAAHTPGVGGSLWRTDLVLHNPGSTAAEAEVALLLRDRDNTDPETRQVSVEAGRTVSVRDVLGSLFAATGAGTLRVTPLTGMLMAQARTYDQAHDGTYGQSISPCRTFAAGPGTMPPSVWLFGLSQSATAGRGFRTNLGLQNLAYRTAGFLVQLFRGDGTPLGARSYLLRPLEAIQRNEMFREVTAAEVSDGYVLITPQDGAEFHAYASVVDNGSNDPIYLPACGE